MSTKDWLEKDFYRMLGVSKDASASEIKKAFRKHARESHPDRNPGNDGAREKFKEVSEAYSVLSDARKRKEYDEARALFGSGAFRRGARMGGTGGMPFDLSDLLNRQGGTTTTTGGGSGGLGDLFGSFFGGGGSRRTTTNRGRDVEAEVKLSFEDAVRGSTVSLTLRSPGVCDTCHGTGAKPGSAPRICQVCGGNGLVTANQGAFSFSEPCRECQGVGSIVDEKCPECRGSGGVTKSRRLSVRIPPGVENGQRIRIKGKGEPGAPGALPGDLYVLAHVGSDDLFGRKGRDLTLTVPVTFPEAALGVDLRVPTFDGAVTVRVPPGTPSGRTFRVRGKGVSAKSGVSGDLLVTVEVLVPKDLPEEARKALAEFTAATDPAPRERLDNEAKRRGWS